jgi:antitoxin YefM
MGEEPPVAGVVSSQEFLSRKRIADEERTSDSAQEWKEARQEGTTPPGRVRCLSGKDSLAGGAAGGSSTVTQTYTGRPRYTRIALWRQEDAVNAVTLKDGKLNLEKIARRVIADAEPTILVLENGEQVVFVPLDEYNSWKETLYLLSSSANADHLRRSIAQAQAGDVHERELLET